MREGGGKRPWALARENTPLTDFVTQLLVCMKICGTGCGAKKMHGFSGMQANKAANCGAAMIDDLHLWGGRRSSKKM